MLKHLAANDEIKRLIRIESRIVDAADGDPISHSRRREPQRGLGEINSANINPKFTKKLHEHAGTATEIEEALRLEHLLNKERIFPLYFAPRIEGLTIPPLSPLAGKILG